MTAIVFSYTAFLVLQGLENRRLEPSGRWLTALKSAEPVVTPFRRVEVFVNIIWRELDMAMALARHQSDGGMAETLNLVFGGERWREIGGLSFVVQADRAVDLLRELYGAR